MGLLPWLLPPLLLAYMAAFVVAYSQEEADVLPRIRYWLVTKSFATPIIMSAGLMAGGHALIILLSHASVEVLQQGLSITDRWNWLIAQETGLLYRAIVYCVPIALLAAMPMDAKWAGTLKKVWQAGLALYALVLCAGVASIIVGILMGGVSNFTGSPGADALQDAWQNLVQQR